MRCATYGCGHIEERHSEERGGCMAVTGYYCEDDDSYTVLNLCPCTGFSKELRFLGSAIEDEKEG